VRNNFPETDDTAIHEEAQQQNAFAAAPVSHNPYAAQFQQRAAQPDLDATAPALTSNELRRLNRRALGFLAGVVLVVGVVALWIFSSLLNRKESAKAPSHEVVTIPAAPSPQLPPPPPPAASAETEAIALAPALPPLPPRPTSAQGPRELTLLERRIADKAPVVGVAGKSANPPAPAPLPPYPGAWGSQGDDPRVPPNSAYTGKPLSPTSSAQPLIRPDALMMRGT